MTFQDLLDFLEHKMSMSHVYQPLLVRAARQHWQLAQVFLSQDESQLLYYEKRIKEMPLKVLTRAWGRFCKWPTRLLEHGSHDTGAKGTRQNAV
jgi:hypothetical protein